MKLTFISTLIATLALSACSTATDVASSTANVVKDVANTTTETVKNTTTSAMDSMKGKQPVFETAAYFCDASGKKNQVVSAVYAFIDGKIDSATITMNRKVIGPEMKFDATYKDGVRFVEGQKVWSLDYGFAQNTVSKTVPVMFTDNNNIVAKNCTIVK